MKKVLITGITGQDGSYLAEFLLENNRWQVQFIIIKIGLIKQHMRKWFYRITKFYREMLLL